MEDLSQKITEILQDPVRMQQITEMTSALGIDPNSNSSDNDPPYFQEALRQVSGILHRTEAKDRRQQTLMRALLPYLSPKRQAKLERAMQISQLSRLAGAALENRTETPITADEEESHV